MRNPTRGNSRVYSAVKMMARHTKKDLVVCPASLGVHDETHSDHFVPSHFVTAKELAKNHGVCRNCAEKFRRTKGNFRGLVAGRNKKISVENYHHPHALDASNDSYAWSETGERVGFTDFDFDSVDRALVDLEEQPADVQAAAAIVLSRLLSYIWSGRKDSRRHHVALVRFTSICAGLRPDLFDNQSFKAIGEQLQVTKAALSKVLTVAEKNLGIKFSRTRSQTARRHMAEARNRYFTRKVGTTLP